MSGNPAPRETTTPAAVASGADLGLYAADDFRITSGRCMDCPTIRQALWYFERETIAVAKEGRPVARFVRGLRFDEDIGAWLAARAEHAQLELPPLVWIAAPHLVSGGRLTGDLTGLVTGVGPLSFRLTPKIPLNRSYFDDSSARFFVGREIKVRGTVTNGAIVARTLWPEDFRLSVAPPARSPPLATSPAIALRQRMRAEKNGGATSPYAIETLWQRPGSNADLRGRAVLAFMINGAQGDDDEAHAGHFALVTGRVQSDGAIGDWLVNNFYTLDAESEKGILAAPVPLDDYLADLNAGQNWYRPSYLLVAVLSAGRAATLVQSALGRVYNQFYRHQIVYYHPATNCTSLSVDTLRALGWDVPARGPTSRPLAWVGFPCWRSSNAPLQRPALRSTICAQTRPASCPPSRRRRSSGVCSRSAAGAARTRIRPARSRGCWRATSMRSSSCVSRNSRRAARGAAHPLRRCANTKRDFLATRRWPTSFRCRRGPFRTRCATPICSRRRIRRPTPRRWRGAFC